jgi:glycosyltransferase involved in cell wall biosynthesis
MDESHPLSPADGPTPARRPRILLVSDYLPQDVNVAVHGAFQRLRRHVEALQAIGDVDVIFLWPWHPDAWNEQARVNLAALQKLWALQGRVELIFSRFTCQLGQLRILLPAWLQRWAGPFGRDGATQRAIAGFAAQNPPDLIFAHRMGAILPAVRTLAGKCAILIDLDDIEHVRMQREAARTKAWLRRLQLALGAWLTRQLEAEALAHASVALVCSESDAAFLRRTGKAGRIALLANAAPEREAPPPASTPTALFVGMVRYWPNAEGLIWLVREVWPLVRRDLPAARLILAGLGSDELGLGDPASGVEALGFTADLAPLYAAARIALCPLHIASGTRIKIVEAAMFARASLSTRIGAEGLAFEPGRDIALAEDAPDFAKACAALLRDGEGAARLGQAARQTAQRLYSPASVSAELARLCREALAGR